MEPFKHLLRLSSSLSLSPFTCPSLFLSLSRQFDYNDIRTELASSARPQCVPGLAHIRLNPGASLVFLCKDTEGAEDNPNASRTLQRSTQRLKICTFLCHIMNEDLQDFEWLKCMIHILHQRLVNAKFSIFYDLFLMASSRSAATDNGVVSEWVRAIKVL